MEETHVKGPVFEERGHAVHSTLAAARNLLSRLFAGRRYLSDLFATAGITVNGPNPWDPQIHDERFFTRTIAQGTLGMGESYMDSDWNCAALDQFFDRAISARLGEDLSLTMPRLVLVATARIRNRQYVAQRGLRTPITICRPTYSKRLTTGSQYGTA